MPTFLLFLKFIHTKRHWRKLIPFDWGMHSSRKAVYLRCNERTSASETGVINVSLPRLCRKGTQPAKLSTMCSEFGSSSPDLFASILKYDLSAWQLTDFDLRFADKIDYIRPYRWWMTRLTSPSWKMATLQFGSFTKLHRARIRKPSFIFLNNGDWEMALEN